MTSQSESGFVRRLALALLLLAGASAPVSAQATQAVDLHALLPFDTLLPRLSEKPVIFVGETHTRYDHHLNQLEIIRRLHQSDPNLAIAVEYLQQPFQSAVDRYIAGESNEQEFLEKTEYFERWGYDYRLYAPIFRFAREKRIPVIALNVPAALTRAVAKSGIAALTPGQRADLPHEIDRSDQGYADRLRTVFQSHPMGPAAGFDHFLEAQLVWDEGMAQRAAEYRKAHPSRRLVVLAGAGHLAYGSGIPKRLARRTGDSYAIVLSSGDESVEPESADFLLFSKEQELPPAGVLGVRLETKGSEVRITAVTPGSGAAQAGLRRGDVLLALDGRPIRRSSDVPLQLWAKKPGDSAGVTIRRRRERTFSVQLRQPKPGNSPERNP